MERFFEKMWRNCHTKINRTIITLIIAAAIHSLIELSLHILLIDLFSVTLFSLLLVLSTKLIRDILWKSSPITFDLVGALKDNGFSLIFLDNSYNSVLYSIKKDDETVLMFAVSTQYDFVSSIYYYDERFGQITCIVSDGRDCCFARINGFNRDILIDTEHAHIIFNLVGADPYRYKSGFSSRELNVVYPISPQ